MKKIKALINKIIFWVIEFTLNVDTAENVEGVDTLEINKELSGNTAHNDSKQYSSLNYLYLYKIARTLPLSKDDVFYDLGCGLGRILFFFSLYRLKKCVGIDMAERYCNGAIANVKRLRIKRTPIEIICADVTKADLSDATIVFLFNPFGEDTMREMLKQLAGTQADNRRSVTIIYYNDLYRNVFEENECFALERDFFETHRSSIWKSANPKQGSW